MNQPSHISLEVDGNPVTRIVQIFERHQAQLRFPDIDAEKLKAFQAAVQKELEAVCAMEEKLAEAREALVLAQKALLDKAAKARAYLQVFATGDPELEAELAEISWNSAERPSRKRRPPSKKPTHAKTQRSTNEADLTSPKQEELATEQAAE